MPVTNILQSTLQQLMRGNGGILAADESPSTLQKRFEPLNIGCTYENRKAYRELLFTTPRIEDYLNGIILHEETLSELDQNNQLFAQKLAQKGILTGIKVDQGLVELPFTQAEKITEGLDKLPERLTDYQKKGAKFAKWRAVFRINGHAIPSLQAIRANAEVLARYAACCQLQGILPMIEPEVLLDGPHNLEHCKAVTLQVLREVFDALRGQHIQLGYVILKLHMITSGNQSTIKDNINNVAQSTLDVLYKTVPPIVPGINFLSGGHTPEQATAQLEAIHRDRRAKPWRLNFSYGRALQSTALRLWQGKTENRSAAQAALYEAARHHVRATQVNQEGTRARAQE